MKQVLAITICLFLCSSSFAQKKKVGFYNSDSLLALMPGYQACVDSTQHYHNAAQIQLASLEKQKADKQHEIDSCKGKDSPIINHLRNTQLLQIQDNIEAYKSYCASEMRTIDSTCKAPYEQKLLDAKNKAVTETGCAVAYKESVARSLYKPEEAEFIDLNLSIARKLIP